MGVRHIRWLVGEPTGETLGQAVSWGNDGDGVMAMMRSGGNDGAGAGTVPMGPSAAETGAGDGENA